MTREETRYAHVPGRQILLELRKTLTVRAPSSIGKVPSVEVVRAIDQLLGSLDDEINEVWTPFQPASMPDLSDDREYVRRLAETAGVSVRDVIGALKMNAEMNHYRNNLYQVSTEPIMEDESRHRPRLIHLSIKRLDQKPIRDWRHLQRIKNEICGPNFEAVELFPAEGRLVDSANQFHLWVFGQPDTQWGFGFVDRLVVHNAGGTGAVQRPLEPPVERRRVLASGNVANWSNEEGQWVVSASTGGSDKGERMFSLPADMTHTHMNVADAMYHLGRRSAEDEARDNDRKD